LLDSPTATTHTFPDFESSIANLQTIHNTLMTENEQLRRQLCAAKDESNARVDALDRAEREKRDLERRLSEETKLKEEAENKQQEAVAQRHQAEKDLEEQKQTHQASLDRERATHAQALDKSNARADQHKLRLEEAIVEIQTKAALVDALLDGSAEAEKSHAAVRQAYVAGEKRLKEIKMEVEQLRREGAEYRKVLDHYLVHRAAWLATDRKESEEIAAIVTRHEAAVKAEV
jgi:DNA repair exonuclease SbcCD ATPase subunit